MTDSTEALYARAIEAADAHGRLPVPPIAEWETFPFEGDLRVRPLLAPTDTDRPRVGEEAADCWRCQRGEEGVIWSDDRWLLASMQKPSGLPCVVLLQPRDHHDLGDLPDDLAAELGGLMIRIDRAITTVLSEIGRVHVCRWGDGSAHFHMWFMARPARLPQLVGSFAAIWDDILPPLPDEIWQANLSVVAQELARSGGTALV
jgi:diadenosine tetraphosphate (Ap4A) HIT family hydrolase